MSANCQDTAVEKKQTYIVQSIYPYFPGLKTGTWPAIFSHADCASPSSIAYICKRRIFRMQKKQLSCMPNTSGFHNNQLIHFHY